MSVRNNIFTMRTVEKWNRLCYFHPQRFSTRPDWIKPQAMWSNLKVTLLQGEGWTTALLRSLPTRLSYDPLSAHMHEWQGVAVHGPEELYQLLRNVLDPVSWQATNFPRQQVCSVDGYLNPSLKEVSSHYHQLLPLGGTGSYPQTRHKQPKIRQSVRTDCSSCVARTLYLFSVQTSACRGRLFAAESKKNFHLQHCP